MVYLAIKGDGVVHHTSKEAMKKMDGLTPELTVADEEFEAAGSLARVIDGKIFIGKTKAEKEAEKKQERIIEIDEELKSIDKASTRASRAVAKALGNGDTPETNDVKKLKQLDELAEQLRAERKKIA